MEAGAEALTRRRRRPFPSSWGLPAGGASIWGFDDAGTATALHTDLAGRVWAPAGTTRVLARAGAAYGWVDAGVTAPPAQMPAAPREEAYPFDDDASYGELFRQEKASRVDASML